MSSEEFYKVYRGLVWAKDPKSDGHKKWMNQAIQALCAEGRTFRVNQRTEDLDRVLDALYLRGAGEGRGLHLAPEQASAIADLFGQDESGFVFATVLPVEVAGYQRPPSGYMTQEDLAAVYNRLFTSGEIQSDSTGASDIRAVHLAALTYLCGMKSGEDPLVARLEFARALCALAGKSEDAFLITERQAAWFVTLFIKRHDFQDIAPYSAGQNPRIPGCNPDGLGLSMNATKTGY